MPIWNRTSNLWVTGYIPVRYHFALNLGGKKEKNVQKGGPGRNRTCDLADNGFIPAWYHYSLMKNGKLSNNRWNIEWDCVPKQYWKKSLKYRGIFRIHREREI